MSQKTKLERVGVDWVKPKEWLKYYYKLGLGLWYLGTTGLGPGLDNLKKEYLNRCIPIQGPSILLPTQIAPTLFG